MRNFKLIARMAGWSYVIIFVTGIFANFFVLESLVVEGDPEASLTNMLNNETKMRIGIGCFLLMVFTDFLITMPLYVLLAPVQKMISLLAAWLRIANAIIFIIALCSLLAILHLIFHSGVDVYSEFQRLATVVNSYIDSFQITWFVGQLFFAAHLLVVGYLIVKGGYIPKWIGIVLIAAGIAYLGDSSSHLLLAHSPILLRLSSVGVVLFGVVGELSLTVWLLVKGSSFWNRQNLSVNL